MGHVEGLPGICTIHTESHITTPYTPAGHTLSHLLTPGHTWSHLLPPRELAVDKIRTLLADKVWARALVWGCNNLTRCGLVIISFHEDGRWHRGGAGGEARD